jgi:hypothetical protein
VAEDERKILEENQGTHSKMKSPFLTLHDAEIARIEAETSYTVYDDLPQQAEFPYVVMGEMIANDWSDKFEPGQEVFSTKHIWSRYKGKKEVVEMSDAILQALTKSALDLSPNFRAVLDELDTNEIIMDIDGITRHGILRTRYLIEEV